MDTLGNPEDYSAFYVACPQDKFQLVCDVINQEKPDHYMVCSEVSLTAHQDTSGHHIHVLASLTDKQYRRIIHNLKRDLNLRGRATGGCSRSYGKVKMIRDLFKMGAYTLKQHLDPQNPNSLIYTNFPDSVVQDMLAASYMKQDLEDFHLPQLFEYISDNFNDIEERNNKRYSTEKNCPYQFIQEDFIIKEAILEFFRHNELSKFPSRSKVNHYATLWAIHHSGWDMSKVIYYFYK